MMNRLTRRSFLGTTATALAAAPAVVTGVKAADQKVVPGFDQTQTEYDKTKVWKPFSDRKIRVGLVGYGY